MNDSTKEYGTINTAIDFREQQIHDLFDMLKRWRGSIYTRHLDIGLLEKAIHERNELERHLINAQNTIHALTERKKNLELFAAQYDPDMYAECLSSRLQSTAGQTGAEVPKV